jgi:hypothetical protein
MLKHKLLIIIAGLALLALGSCGTSNIGTGGPGLGGAHGVADFHLDVMPETYDFGATASDVYLSIDPKMQTDTHVVVDVNVEGAQGLKTLYFNLQYDPALYRPMVVEPTTAMGDKANLLTLMGVIAPGHLQYGQTLVHQDLQVGLTGTATVAQISFRKESDTALRGTSAPPDSNLSRITSLTFDGVDTLTWFYAFQGDYGQDGEVSVADLTPLGQNFKEISPAGLPNPFPITMAESQVDGDNNGQCNINDLTWIGQNLGKNALGGFHVFRSANQADAPTTATGPNGAGAAEIGVVQVGDALNLAQKSTERLRYEFTIAAPVANDFYWVRPFDSNGAAGIASNVAGGNPAALPALSLTTAAESGSGTAADPYVFLDTTNYTFTLLDAPGGNDVSTDPLTTFNVSVPAAGTFTGNVLDVAAGFQGDFVVTGTYNGNQNHNSSDIYVHVGTVVPGNTPVIDKDPADPDWTGVTGDGQTEATAYILHTSTFNPDSADADTFYDLVFSLQATDGPGGAVIPNANLDWDCFPPFCVADFTTYSTTGTFQAWDFTSGYLFAQDPAQPGAPGKSNDLHVAVQSLPN